mgnify:CR=1 FL=1
MRAEKSILFKSDFSCFNPVPIASTTDDIITTIITINYIVGCVDVQQISEIDFILEVREGAVKNHSDAFITYINQNYPLSVWPVRKACYLDIGFFFLKISKQDDSQDLKVDTSSLEKWRESAYQNVKKLSEKSDIKFFRYYSDQKEYVSEKLNLKLEESNALLFSSQSAEAAKDLSKDIPDYTKLI